MAPISLEIWVQGLHISRGSPCAHFHIGAYILLVLLFGTAVSTDLAKFTQNSQLVGPQTSRVCNQYAT